MGVRFPRTDFSNRFAYFPTAHSHGDGVHETEQYDHALFLQGSFPGAPSGWRGAEAPHMPYVRRCAFFDPTLPVYKKNIRGKWANGDVLVDLKTAITHMATTKMPSPKDKTVSVPAILQTYSMSPGGAAAAASPSPSPVRPAPSRPAPQFASVHWPMAQPQHPANVIPPFPGVDVDRLDEASAFDLLETSLEMVLTSVRALKRMRATDGR
jgi:hypothetical protein